MGNGNKPPLGRLAQVDLREYWEHEAAEFTPWMAQPQNLALLGEALGIGLELQGTEASVGPFSADIVCKNTSDDSIVLVENQLERTDHRHLGQILTYAAGVGAKTVVWVAKEFTEQHRAAIDWINRITHEEFEAYGVVVELWRIDSSAPAPKFHVVAQPNDWARTTRESATEPSATRGLYQEYWAEFQTFLKRAGSPLAHVPVSNPRHWLRFSIGTAGFRLSAVVKRQAGLVAAQFVIHAKNAKDLFAALLQDKRAIERELGEGSDWVPEASRCVVRFQREADVNDRAAWPEFQEWQREKLEALDRAFRPRVATLQAEVGAGDREDE